MEHEEIGTPFGEALRIEFLVFLRSMSFKLLMVFWFVKYAIYSSDTLYNLIVCSPYIKRKHLANASLLLNLPLKRQELSGC